MTFLKSKSHETMMTYNTGFKCGNYQIIIVLKKIINKQNKLRSDAGKCKKATVDTFVQLFSIQVNTEDIQFCGSNAQIVLSLECHSTFWIAKSLLHDKQKVSPFLDGGKVSKKRRKMADYWTMRNFEKTLGFLYPVQICDRFL